MNKLNLTDREIEIVSRIGMASLDIFNDKIYNQIKADTYAAVLQIINCRSVEVSISSAKILRAMLANAINSLPYKQKYKKLRIEMISLRLKLLDYILMNERGE